MIRSWQLGILTMFLLASAAGQVQPPTLRVLVFDNVGIPAEILSHAERRASEIFREAGLTTVWYGCPTQQSSEGNCSGPFGSDAVFIQMVHDTAKTGETVFGAAFLGTDGYGQHADIFVDRVKRVSEHSRVSVPVLMGCILAHEIGHLLLGPGAHSSSGIMEATWRREQLQKAEIDDLWFSKTESKVMRDRLVTILSPGLAELSRAGQ